MHARKYAEISHFRAPFKNWPVLAGYGADAGDATATTVVDPVAALIDTDPKTGIRTFKAVVVDAIMTMLEAYSVIFLDNDNVKIEPRLPSDVRETAAAWTKRHVADGKTVVAGSPAGAQFVPAPVTFEKFLMAVNPTESAEAAATATTPSAIAAIIARPSAMAGMFGRLGPVGVGAIALLAVGGVLVVAKGGKKRHATSNRKKPYFFYSTSQSKKVANLAPPAEEWHATDLRWLVRSHAKGSVRAAAKAELRRRGLKVTK